ncbi:MAG: DUF697 domain-containing protein [Cyanobacteria bacterium J06635_15]
MQFNRPILIGGLGLSASLWLLDVVNHSIMDGSTLIGAIAVGSGVWWWRKRFGQDTAAIAAAPPVDRALVEQRLQRVEQILATWAEETDTLEAAKQASLRQQIDHAEAQRQQLGDDLDRQQLAFTIAGEKAVGKTALMSHLNQQWQAPAPYQVDVKEQVLPDASKDDDAGALSAKAATPSADLVIFLTAGDLTDSEFQQLQSFVQQGQRFLIGLNKQDSLPPLDRAVVQQQLQTRLAQLQVESPVMTLAAAPKPMKLRRHQTDGTVEETLTQPEPDTADLQQYLSQLVRQDAAQLVLETTLRQAEALRRKVQTQINALKRDRALPIITQFQWLSGAAAFANPVPTLDLVATAAITAQLIVDLGEVYDGKFSLEQAKTAAGTLASLVIKLGLVELSTEALAGLLKSNSATYLAGGLIQGVSAAYLTRLAGLGLVEWFEVQTLEDAPQKDLNFALENLGERLRTLFEQTKGSLLPTLMQQGLTRWMGAARSLPAGNPPLSLEAAGATLTTQADSSTVEFSAP